MFHILKVVKHLKLQDLKSIITLVLIFFLCSCTKQYEFGLQKEIKEKTNLKQIAQSPSSYSSEIIELTGFYFCGFEESGLHETRINRNNGQAIWVELGLDIQEKGLDYNTLQEFNGKKIKVQGVFDPDEKGHLSHYLGTIKVDYLTTN